MPTRNPIPSLKSKLKMKVIISGGGTGGHIFPAIAIAQELKNRDSAIQILFIGANGKMEMEKVPQAGFDIKGLDVVGYNRSNIFKNLLLPFKLAKSLGQAKTILKAFNPSIVIGVGGYASGPTLYMANRMGIPTLIQEQNSFAGKTNKILAKKAKKICVAYDGMNSFFDQDKIVLTGNPVRKDLIGLADKKSEAISYFGLKEGIKTVLVMGGSLGANTLNQTMAFNIDTIAKNNQVQWIWQFGKQGIGKFDDTNFEKPSHVKSMPFIDRVDLAFAAADVVLCRAGALTISELLIANKPAVLVPAPYVAEDHQTHNASSLETKGAAVVVKDNIATTEALQKVYNLLHDVESIEKMKSAQKSLARPYATESIVNEIFKLIPQAA
jgi:UDP-N-acetylglucosamine--N-acetylmuramyl-(pentapeptide) pyrophosphoryl-undecaprenol N-acetylglucosamine transferase